MITKNKPDTINKTNGNAFAFKVNLKFDTSIEDVSVEKSVNDYSTVALELFYDVLTEMRSLQTKFNDKLLELESLKTDVDLAKDALLNTTSLTSISTRLSDLETTVAASTSAFAEATSIMMLIDSVNSRIDELLSGTVSLQIKYNTDSFKPGYGMVLDKTIPGQIVFASGVQNYSVINEVDFSFNIQGEKYVKLGIGGTQIRHLRLNGSGNPIPFTLTRDLTLYIDDSINAWRLGQTLRIVCDSQIIPSSYAITVKTDSQNITNSLTSYNTIITQLTAADFPTTYGRTGTTIIDIICTNAKTLTFSVDKIIR